MNNIWLKEERGRGFKGGLGMNLDRDSNCVSGYIVMEHNFEECPFEGGEGKK